MFTPPCFMNLSQACSQCFRPTLPYTIHADLRGFTRLAGGTVSQFSLPLRKNSAGKWNWNAVSTKKNGFQNVLLSAGREEKRKRKWNSKFILQQSWKDSWVSWHVISSPTLFFTPNPKYRVTKSLHLEDGDFSALRRRDCGHDRSFWICVFSWLEGMVNVLVNQFYHVETVLKRLHIKGLSNTAQGLTQFLNFSSSVYFKMNQFIEKTPLIEKMWKVILSTLVTRNLFLEDRLVRNFSFIVSLLYLKTHMWNNYSCK